MEEATNPPEIDGPFLVIGRAGMDLAPEPAATAIEDANTFSTSLGGSSANIAVGLTRLGATASLVTCVSDDPIGQYCINQLDAYGVNRTHVRKVGGEFRNSLALTEARVLDHRTVIYRNGAADFQMDTTDIDAIDFTAFKTVIATGTVFAAEPSRSACFLAFEKARDAGCRIVFDIDYRPYSWQSAEDANRTLTRAGDMANIVVGNDEEYAFMAGGRDGEALARKLGARDGGFCIYKMGPHGAKTFHGDTLFRTGIFPANALKPTGAGDSFLAGLLTSLDGTRSLKEAVIRGSACASIVVSKPGCAPAMPDDATLEKFLKSNTITPTS